MPAAEECLLFAAALDGYVKIAVLLCDTAIPGMYLVYHTVDQVHTYEVACTHMISMLMYSTPASPVE